MRTHSDRALIEAIRHTRDYLGDSKYHPALTKWHYAKARRILSVDASLKWGWLLRWHWQRRLREIGLDPESLSVTDEFRWSVALEMIHDPALANTFSIKEFRERLNIARLKERSPDAQNAPEPEQRRVMLERFGIELD